MMSLLVAPPNNVRAVDPCVDDVNVRPRPSLWVRIETRQDGIQDTLLMRLLVNASGLCVAPFSGGVVGG